MIPAIDPNDSSSGGLVPAIRRDFRCFAWHSATPCVSRFSVNYGRITSLKAALPDEGRYAKSSVRQNLEKISPPRFERGTFGSGGRRLNRVKPKRGSYLRRSENREVLVMVLSNFPGFAAICRDLQ